jgi:hypothetical protein
VQCWHNCLTRLVATLDLVALPSMSPCQGCCTLTAAEPLTATLLLLLLLPFPSLTLAEKHVSRGGWCSAGTAV